MLRTLDYNNKELFLNQLSVLKFVSKYKKEIIDKLNGKKLSYDIYSDSDSMLDDISIKEKPGIDPKADTITITDLVLLNYNINEDDENTVDTTINLKYVKYLQDKVEASFDEDSLVEYYDESKDEYIYLGEDYGSGRISEIIVSSSKIDKFLNTYKKNTVEYEFFKSHIIDLVDFVRPCDNAYFDIRTKTNQYYHFDTLVETKYQVCIVVYDYTGSYTSRKKEFDELLESIWMLNELLESDE